MPQHTIEFKETAGKTIEKITLTNESDYRSLSVCFTDKTALHVSVTPRVEFDAVLENWKTGNLEPIKTYPRISESK
jgi:hypothetical protein